MDIISHQLRGPGKGSKVNVFMTFRGRPISESAPVHPPNTTKILTDPKGKYMPICKGTKLLTVHVHVVTTGTSEDEEDLTERVKFLLEETLQTPASASPL